MMPKRYRCCQMLMLCRCLYLLLVTGALSAHDRDVCEFPAYAQTTQRLGKNETTNISYSYAYFDCVDCTTFKTLVSHNAQLYQSDQKAVCQEECNGLLCGENATCREAGAIKQRHMMICLKQSRMRTPDHFEPEPTQNQAPIIIGFAIGGVMLAVVVGGVFLGRSRTADQTDSSEIMTTPVSMSYTEWISNHSSGGRGSKGSNLRVQEAKDELGDNTPVPVYNIVYDGSGSEQDTTPKNDQGPVVIEVDDNAPDVLRFEFTDSSSWNDLTSYHHPDNDKGIFPTRGLNDSAICFSPLSSSRELLRVVDDEGSPHSYEEPAFHRQRSESDSVAQRARLLPGADDPNSPNDFALPHDHVRRSLYNDNEKGPKVSDSPVAGPVCGDDDDVWSDDSDEPKKLGETPATQARSFRHQYGGSPSDKVLVSLPVSPDGHVVNAANITHVFVDVHRNMTCSSENIQQATLHDKSNSLYHGLSYTRNASSFKTPVNLPLDKTPKRAADIPMTAAERTEWQQRTRLSSSASGEYAIPYGSLRF